MTREISCRCVSRVMQGFMRSVGTGGIKNETAFFAVSRWNGQVSNLHSAWKVFDKFPQQFGPLRAPLPTNILFVISLSSINFIRLKKEKSVCKKLKRSDKSTLGTPAMKTVANTDPTNSAQLL